MVQTFAGVIDIFQRRVDAAPSFGRSHFLADDLECVSCLGKIFNTTSESLRLNFFSVAEAAGYADSTNQFRSNSRPAIAMNLRFNLAAPCASSGRGSPTASLDRANSRHQRPAQ